MQAQEANSGPRPIFEFHSGFWLNLHHFLYQQARIAEHIQTSQGGARSAGTDPNKISDPSPAWQAAVDYYRKNMAHRDLLFDQNMVLINERLADLETCPDLSGRTITSCTSGLQANMIAALEGAAPIYRTRWWSDHDRKNRDWIDGDAPLVRQIGLPLAEDLSSVYQKPWQREPIRVDVVIYAGPFGAYTSLDPTHITVASGDPRNEGLAGFEIAACAIFPFLAISGMRCCFTPPERWCAALRPRGNCNCLGRKPKRLRIRLMLIAIIFIRAAGKIICGCWKRIGSRTWMGGRISSMPFARL
jgi:hypothetical protein